MDGKNELVEVSNQPQLSALYEGYIRIEKEFGKVIGEQILSKLSNDFDLSLLKLEDALTNIGINSENGDGGVHIAKIRDTDYGGEIADLYEDMKALNGIEIDGFLIEVQDYNLHHEATALHQVNFRIIRKTSIIDGVTSTENDGVSREIHGVTGTTMRLIGG